MPNAPNVLTNIKPNNAPTKSDGPNIPPLPPEPTVMALANTLINNIAVENPITTHTLSRYT